MQFVIRASLVLAAAALLLPQSGKGSVIFKPGQKAEWVPPGEEEMNGDAAQLFKIAEAAEKEGNVKRAIKAYKTIVKRHPKDALAPGAA